LRKKIGRLGCGSGTLSSGSLADQVLAAHLDLGRARILRREVHQRIGVSGQSRAQARHIEFCCNKISLEMLALRLPSWLDQARSERRRPG
jgi:hypothetical protein